MSPPESVQTTDMAIKIRDMSLDLGKWHKVPFPSPFSPSFDYVYTVNRDAGTFIISMRARHASMFMPVSLEATLAEICAAPGISTENLRQRSPPFFPDCEGHNNLKLDPGTWKPWFHPVNLPTAMTELSQLFFIDFVSMWRPWIGDPMSWYYGSPVFNCISRALLRLASWDFEVLYTDDAPLPVSNSSIPAWDFPESEHYWFHGFLVLLQEDLEWPQSLRAAVERSQSLINTSGCIAQRTQSILISPQDIVFVEFSSGEIKCGEVFPLLTDSSSMECSPGFRLLSQIMSSSCSRMDWAYREKWSLPLPSEVLANILQVSEPRDAVSFAQSSFKVEQWYYDSLPQIQDIELQHLHLSVPCCVERTGLETLGIHCSECGIWQHAKCIGLETLPSENSFVCASCLKPDPRSSMLTTGGSGGTVTDVTERMSLSKQI